MTLQVTIKCPECGASRQRKVYGYQDAATWTDNEEVRCMRCGSTAVEITVNAQGRA